MRSAPTIAREMAASRTIAPLAVSGLRSAARTTFRPDVISGRGCGPSGRQDFVVRHGRGRGRRLAGLTKISLYETAANRISAHMRHADPGGMHFLGGLIPEHVGGC